MTDKISYDPFRTEIAWSRLTSAVDESALALMRTAFSGVVRDNLDFACGIFDSEARLLVQDGIGTPGLAGPMPRAIHHFLEAFPPARLRPGDILITNDPWMVSGHKHDTTVLTPVFDDDVLIGYTMSVAHQIDVGGRGMTLESRDVHEEGFALRPAYLSRAGEPNSDVWNFIADNVRFPEMVIGDLEAQIASNDISARHLRQMHQHLGVDSFVEIANTIIERTANTTRSAIESIKDGDYSAVLPIEWPPSRATEDRDPLQLAVTIRVRGNEIVVDYEGTSPQVDMAFNSPLNGLTTSYTLMALKCVLNPNMPMNHGFLGSISITAPEGTLLNPRRPAAVRGRNYLAHVIPELIFSALEQVVPDRVIAPSGTAPAWNQQIEGTHSDGERYAHFFPVRGGLGARPDRDGISCISFPTNVSTLQVEVLEANAPLIVQRKEIRRDSGGPGKYRGGAGQDVSIRILEGALAPTTPVYVGVQGGKLGSKVPGYRGGKQGAPGSIRLNGDAIGGGKLWRLGPGDLLEYSTPGGGGYYNPRDREREAIRRDIIDGYVSAERAEDDYGLED